MRFLMLDGFHQFVYGVRMQMAEVLGSVTAPEQVASLRSHRLLAVRRVDADGQGYGLCEVAVDLVGAGPGDRVLLVAGSAARQVHETRTVATDLAVVAIVDSVDLTEGVAPRVVVTTRLAKPSASTSEGRAAAKPVKSPARNTSAS
jgi:microcompartment protein CcmK/EutM